MPQPITLAIITKAIAHTLILIGGSTFFGLSTLPLGGRHWTVRLALGFSLMPLITAYLGLAGVFRAAPWLVQALGWLYIAFAVAWLGLGLTRLARKKGKDLPWLALVVPLLMLAALFWCKFHYLSGGVDNGDDMRSMLLTGSFAANYLKPAFPFDLSIPVSYSYYLYETSAFLYAFSSGSGLASEPVLIVNIMAVALFFCCLWRVSSALFKERVVLGFTLAAAAIAFCGWDFVNAEFIAQNRHVEWWNIVQVTTFASYMVWTYQYVWTLGICILALYFHHKATEEQSLAKWALFCIFLILSAGFGAITFVWTSAALFLLTLGDLARKGKPHLLFLLKGLPITVGIVVLGIAPVIFAYIGREQILSLTPVPHWWFHTQPPLTDISAFFNQVMTGLIEWGPLLVMGIFAGFWTAFRPKADPLSRRLGLVMVISALGVTFTRSPFFDWHCRGGFFILTVLGGLMITDLVLRRVEKLHGRAQKTASLALVVLLILPGGYTAYLELRHRAEDMHHAPDSAFVVNKMTPLHTVLYFKDPIPYPFLSITGRAVLTPEYPVLSTYMNDEDFLREKLGWTQPFTPCTSTRYGESTPDGQYVEFDPDSQNLRSCPEK